MDISMNINSSIYKSSLLLGFIASYTTICSHVSHDHNRYTTNRRKNNTKISLFIFIKIYHTFQIIQFMFLLNINIQIHIQSSTSNKNTSIDYHLKNLQILYRSSCEVHHLSCDQTMSYSKRMTLTPYRLTYYEKVSSYQSSRSQHYFILILQTKNLLQLSAPKLHSLYKSTSLVELG